MPYLYYYFLQTPVFSCYVTCSNCCFPNKEDPRPLLRRCSPVRLVVAGGSAELQGRAALPSSLLRRHFSALLCGPRRGATPLGTEQQ